LAWTKEKTTTLYDDKMYNSVELMMHSTAKKVFESQASLICCLYNDITLLDKEGNILEENIKNKKGEDIGTKFHETQVNMYFRPSQYISIAGGRFTNLPEKVPYSAENFLQVFEDAVKGQLKNPDKIEEIRKAEVEVKEQRAKEIEVPVEPEKDDTTPQQVIGQIDLLIEGMKPLSSERTKQLTDLFTTNLQMTNYKKATDVAALQKCVEVIKQM
jgi:hypothetical protein